DAAAQRIHQLEQLVEKQGKQLVAKDELILEQGEQLREKDEQINVKDEQLMVQGKQLIVQGEQLISQSEQIRAKDERIKQVSEQTASPAKRAKQQGRRTDVKKSKVETSFIPWNGAGNACFVLDGARVKFWNGDALTDLKLRNNSKTHKFLPILSGGALSKAEVKKEICTQKTSPYDAVRDVNRLLNGKIKKLNIKKVPQDTAFVACDKRTGHYYSTLPIKSFQEFDLS
ncbi:MAG: hypothetical protein ACYSU8_05965, partial [Planctomycetota bacterium]